VLFILKPEHDINIIIILVRFSNTQSLDFEVSITHYKLINRMLTSNSMRTFLCLSLLLIPIVFWFLLFF
jgi:hypothetical protein